MQRLPLKDFVDAHPDFAARDAEWANLDSDAIARISVLAAPQQIAPVFSDATAFQSCKIELLNAERLEFPLEAIERIRAAVNLTQHIFVLAVGRAPKTDELTPLFNYALLTSGLSKVFSLYKYLEHFLLDVGTGSVRFVEKEKSAALTQFINHVSSLQQVLQKRLP
jgi:hypothetical protein